MDRRNGTTLFAASVLLYIACDPKQTVQGVVHDPGGATVAGAAVGVRCPAGSTHTITITDASGKFRSDGMGGLPLDCVVQIRGGAGQVVEYQVADVCRERLFSACTLVEIAAVLPVAAPGSTPAP
jgi:hypothetical protein